MVASPKVESFTQRPLPLAQEPPRGASFARHPNDGWRFADPYPMGPRLRRRLRGLILALCPRAPAPDGDELLDLVEMHVLRQLPYFSTAARLGFCLAVLVLDWSPRLLLASSKRIEHLERARAAHLVARLSASHHALVRTLVVAVRGLVLSAYFDQDEVHRALGYEPMPFFRERVELRRRLLSGERA